MKETSSAMRHRSREVALQVLYAVDLAARGAEDGRKEGAASAQAAFDAVASHFELPEAARAFAEELVSGVSAHRAELDARIAALAHRWRVERMAAVDRNILRLSAYEILHTELPAEVAIDEAVELARRFGGERSPAFVNGVLDGLAREQAAGAPRAAEAPGGARVEP